MSHIIKYNGNFSEEKKVENKNKENKGDNNNDLMAKINKMIDEKIEKINQMHDEKISKINQLFDAKISKINQMFDERMEKQFFSFIDISAKITLLNSLLMKISFIINTSKLNKESIEKYYDLRKRNIDSKLLIDELSSTIYILQNANIINLKRKLVECLLYEIFENYKEDLIFDKKYFPGKCHLDKLSSIIKEAFDK